jgi:hypothetical protein
VDKRDIEDRLRELRNRGREVSGQVRYLQSDKMRYESEASDAARNRPDADISWSQIQQVWNSSEKAKRLEKLEAEEREINWNIRVWEAKKLLCRE